MSDNFSENQQNISNELQCKDCGALLKYAPGTEKLACKYCGAQNEIITSDEKVKIEEIDYHDFINNKINQEEKQTVSTVKCNNCGATTTLKPHLTSDNCAFCASPLVIQGGTTSTILKPKYLLPFKIDDKNAHQIFVQWINGLWFAPNDLKKYATINEKLKGLYMPYWTYDSNATTLYDGERGDYYYEDANKKERKIKWTSVNGKVSNTFDDVCVLASKSLPDHVTRNLEPWDLQNMTAYKEAYISGFQTECYQTDVKQGFDVAKGVMEDIIKSTIKRDIGGDEQRIGHMHVMYEQISFKHILLPIWISAYAYHTKVYRFIINGRTGEVQGQRPYSAIKIALAILAVIAFFVILKNFGK